MLDMPHEERRKKKIVEFMKRTGFKLKELETKVSEEVLFQRLKTDEFYQIFIEIMKKIQTESREKLKEAYSNFLVNLLKTDPKIDFNKKMHFLGILDKISADHLRLLSIFYGKAHKGSAFSLDAIHKQMGCYERRKPIPGKDSYPLFSEDGTGTYLNDLRASYANSLLSSLIAQELIRRFQQVTSTPDYNKEKKEIEGVNSELSEDYNSTDLGKEFFSFLSNKFD